MKGGKSKQPPPRQEVHDDDDDIELEDDTFSNNEEEIELPDNDIPLDLVRKTTVVDNNNDDDDDGEVKMTDEDMRAQLAAGLLKSKSAFPGVEVEGEVGGDQSTVAKSKKTSGGGFPSFGLNQRLMRGITRKGYKCPTPIQRKAIPILMNGRDAVAMARTGSGKTAAYLIPMLQMLDTHAETVGIRGIVLSPTRELALQTIRFLKELGRYSGLKYCLVVGGSALEEQFTDLAGNPDIVIATPGRLLHIIHETRMELKVLKFMVFDEGDRLFELGFQAQILELLKRVPENCQKALFSATMPAVLAEFATAGLHNPVLVRLDTDIRISDELALSFFVVREEERLPLLLYLLDYVIRSRQDQVQCAVFVPTKYHVEFYEMILKKHGHTCSIVHGTLDQEARKEAISSFYKRKTMILLVTDVAARGLDIPLLDYVINASFPSNEKLFIHRVGRVARAGRSGKAFSLVGFDEVGYLLDVHLGLHRELKNEPEDGDVPRSVNYVGTVPSELLDRYAEYLNRYRVDPEVPQIEKCADNAYKQYRRTRPSASRPSCAKSKGFVEPLVIHPELRTLYFDQVGGTAKDNDLAQRRAVMLREIRAVRTGGNIFEINDGRQTTKTKEKDERAKRRSSEADKFVEHARQVKARRTVQLEEAKETGSKAVALGDTLTSLTIGDDAAAQPQQPKSLAQRLVLRSKRRAMQMAGGSGLSVMDAEIDAFTEAGGRHRPSRAGDEKELEYFVPYLPDRSHDTVEDGDGAQALRDVTLDVHADSLEGMQNRRSVYTWNRKKNQYMKQDISQAKLLLRGLKNEAGAKVNIKTDHKTYQKWSERTKMRIQDIGEEEDRRAVNMPRKRGRYARGGPEESAETEDTNPARRGKGNDGKPKTFQQMLQEKKRKEKKNRKGGKKGGKKKR